MFKGCRSGSMEQYKVTNVMLVGHCCSLYQNKRHSMVIWKSMTDQRIVANRFPRIQITTYNSDEIEPIEHFIIYPHQPANVQTT